MALIDMALTAWPQQKQVASLRCGQNPERSHHLPPHLWQTPPRRTQPRGHDPRRPRGQERHHLVVHRPGRSGPSQHQRRQHAPPRRRGRGRSEGVAVRASCSASRPESRLRVKAYTHYCHLYLLGLCDLLPHFRDTRPSGNRSTELGQLTRLLRFAPSARPSSCEVGNE